jgi:multiple sugar transport system substrate-binding protein
MNPLSGRRSRDRTTIARITRVPKAVAGAWQWLVVFAVGGLIGAVAALGLTGWLPGSAADDATGNDKLIVVAGRDDSGARENRIKAYNQWVRTHNEGVPEVDKWPEAELILLPASADQQHAELIQRVQAQAEGSSQAPVDVLALDAPWTAEFASAGHLRKVPQLELGDFLEKTTATCRYDGRYYCVPLNSDVGLLFRRAPAADTRTDDPEPVVGAERCLGYDSMADLLEDNGDAPSAFGGQFPEGEQFVVNTMEFASAYNAAARDQFKDGEFQSDVGGDALRALSAYLRDSSVISAASRDDDHDEAATTEGFLSNEMNVMRNWSTAIPPLDQADPGSVQTIEVAQLCGSSVLGGQNLAVSEYSERPEAAARLVRFLTSGASQLRLYEEGGFAPTRADVYAELEATELEAAQSEPDMIPIASILRGSIESAILRPKSVNYPLFSRVFVEKVRTAVLRRDGTLSPDNVDAINRAFEGRLEEESSPRGTAHPPRGPRQRLDAGATRSCGRTGCPSRYLGVADRSIRRLGGGAALISGSLGVEAQPEAVQSAQPEVAPALVPVGPGE